MYVCVPLVPEALFSQLSRKSAMLRPFPAIATNLPYSSLCLMLSAYFPRGLAFVPLLLKVQSMDTCITWKLVRKERLQALTPAPMNQNLKFNKIPR